MQLRFTASLRLVHAGLHGSAKHLIATTARIERGAASAWDGRLEESIIEQPDRQTS